ncbi:hypothetical protein HYH02_015065 [Chlamydomonas schloesseri]|uniref:Glycosyltransferase n=1 Tax=Chlamydomonas schloesseri TaxID=2026947 RepID=A0A835SSJ1_9CHLO|nr:hypothetical protein HYH02_015065 [Chlamydomonas schloesseri]|eukprot:KAG2425121.1 hypothetical protein HYH02_015065 [Chlamydomonas schloesseri]
MGAQGITDHCFNAPQERVKYKGKDANYKWGGHHWTQTTWNKVHIIKAVYEFGVNVIHSDTDVVWFSDPLPFFHERLSGPVHVMMATDAVATGNPVGDTGLEANTNPFTNINTGIYFIKQYRDGLDMFKSWLDWQDKNIGHDQDGFNTMARGSGFRHEDKHLPPAVLPADATSNRYFYAAMHNTTGVSFLPASMFGNTYTYVNARLWEKLKHPLYAIHWVWGGSTLESKRQNMRDAMKFHDEPDYYTSPHLVTFDLDLLPTPGDYNNWMMTEEMIRFHVQAANYQLQQAYYAFAIALIANRTLVMPRFQCYCSKNWYQTQQCRINFEKATTFPFTCALSHVLRVKKLQAGFRLPDNTEYSGHRVLIREYSFLDNPKVPDSLKKSFVEIVPSQMPRAASLAADALVVSVEPAPRGYGQRVTVAAPLSDRELRQVVGRFKNVRVLHFPQPARTLSGFSTYATGEQYDVEIQKHVAYWCCRTPPDMQSMNLTDKVQLVALPPERYKNLPAHGGKSSYLHETGPIRRMPGQIF